MTQSGRRFGHYDVIPLLDGVFEAPLDVIIHATGEAARRRLIDNWGEKAIRIDVNCFALRGPNGISLIDAGSGNAWGAALGKAREAMREADILPEQIDRVLLTHIHGDHALGLLDGESTTQIAAKLQISPITVRTRLMRVRAILRRELRAYVESEVIHGHQA